MFDFPFFVNSIALGVGLAMDAFSVSLANGLHEPTMSKRKQCGVAATFGVFQGLMPLLGWVCVRTIVQCFQAFEKCVPFIALALLLFIGGKMLYEGLKGGDEAEPPKVGLAGVLVQGVATSIDALSVGFTIADYTLPMALVAAGIIAAVTFGLCAAGIAIGKRFGTAFSDKATVFGGVILIVIGLEIFITGLL
ncbi:MAG: manganese efflux pump [Clostridia bacterium]|nr:manganese efflux pump [Clostridia bacterium]